MNCRFAPSEQKTKNQKKKTIFFPENSIAAIFLTSIIQVLLEHSSSHKAYATVTIFIYVQSGYLLKKNLFVHKGQFFLPPHWYCEVLFNVVKNQSNHAAVKQL